jgi:hypothetical protein
MKSGSLVWETSCSCMGKGVVGSLSVRGSLSVSCTLAGGVLKVKSLVVGVVEEHCAGADVD